MLPWTIAFHFGIDAVRQSAQVVHLRFNQVSKVDRAEVNLQPASIHLGEKQQVFHNARNPKGLMNQRGDFLARCARQIPMRAQLLESGAEDSDWSLKLLGGIGRKARGPL